MAKTRTVSRPITRGYGPIDLVIEQHHFRRSGEGRQFLKHMDRRLKRFGSKVGLLEEYASRLSDNDNSDLILAVESLRRETLLLRSEIRDNLAGRKGSSTEMAEYVEESWEELQDNYKELKENLEPEDTSSNPGSPGSRSELEDEGEDWSWDEDEWVDVGDESSASEIHPPRLGPKR